MTTMATAAMINNKVTTNDWFLGFTLPPKYNSEKDYTNMNYLRNSPTENLIHFSNILSRPSIEQVEMPILHESYY